VLCGDATKQEDVARLLAGREPLLMVTDPPYGIELDSEWRDRAGLKHRTWGEANGVEQGAGEGQAAVSSTAELHEASH
jgi:hypothetical protein